MDPSHAIELTDPATMRVLAHPTRLHLLGELRVNGPSSVGTLSKAVDEAPGSVSYHLSRLADVGLVTEAPDLAPDRRQRWWRSVHEATITHPSQDRLDPERAAASTALRKSFVRRLARTHEEHLDHEHALPAEWVAAGTSGDRFLHLTVEELTELSGDLEALVARWQARSNPHREGTRTVTALYAAFPRA